MTTPFVPSFGPPSVLRGLYRSLVQVQRLVPSLTPGGGMSLAWQPLSVQLDVTIEQPGFMWCRMDIGFLRPGKDQPAPLVAGRAPDRVGLCYFDMVTDGSGALLVRAGDRLICTQGPIYGTFDVRVIPEVAQDYIGGHHVEVQVLEVAKQTQAGGLTPFPGGAP